MRSWLRNKLLQFLGLQSVAADLFEIQDELGFSAAEQPTRIEKIEKLCGTRHAELNGRIKTLDGWSDSIHKQVQFIVKAVANLEKRLAEMTDRHDANCEMALANNSAIVELKSRVNSAGEWAKEIGVCQKPVPKTRAAKKKKPAKRKGR